MNAAVITNIQGLSLHDEPGIWTVVFFKGCPLSCQWCTNPECLSKKPQIGFINSLCQQCGKCLNMCPNNAIRAGENVYRIGSCTENIPGFLIKKILRSALRAGFKEYCASVLNQKFSAAMVQSDESIAKTSAFDVAMAI